MEFVLSDEESRPFDALDMWVGDIAPNDTKAFLTVLNKYLPIRELAHLKRLRKTNDDVGTLSILLAPINTTDLGTAEAVVAKLTEWNAAVAPLVSNVRVVGVSRWPALTRDQFAAFSPAWPMYWRESAARKNPMTSAADQLEYGELMQGLIADVVVASSSHRPCGAGLAYNPNTRTVLARSVDTRHVPGRPLIQHAAMNVITAVAALPRTKRPTATDHLIHGGLDDASVSRKRRSQDSQHLCSNLMVVLTHEPCIMCAMALLHSRVAGVVYAVPSPATGGLGSWAKVHTERKLNHKFMAWRGCCEDEVREQVGEMGIDWHY
ncbi:cytidine deaminase-like protein [Blastocladiella britannica]|nr:cytidine deaminase-like protein [Blastocladiella britannica]